jgi:FMN-dependent NADH-azoreductase
MSLYRLDASIRGEASASGEIADVVEDRWRAGRPDAGIVRRHIGLDPLPADAWANAVSAGAVAPEERSADQRAAVGLASELVDELLGADAVLLALPLYNFGVSQHVKSWIDLVLTDERATPGSAVLEGTPVVLVTARGGAYGPGTPRHGWDHATPYLTRILGDVWGADLTVVEREFTLVGVNPALDDFRDVAVEMHTSALDAARVAGDKLVG